MSSSFSELPLREAITVLSLIGDYEAASDLRNVMDNRPDLADTPMNELSTDLNLRRARWRGSEHSFGYITPSDDPNLAIHFAGNIEPDHSLLGTKINIKLGGLYTMNYPGRGRHQVLMHFNARHAKPDNPSEYRLIQFQQKFMSREGEGAGGMGEFVFLGLNVPRDGIQFEVETININNEQDEMALEVLNDESVKGGLDLLTASFSTLAPLSKMAQGLIGVLLTHSRNKQVQRFTLGFDFNATSTKTAKLREGTYIAAQVKAIDLDWDDWVYDRSRGIVVYKANRDIEFPYNSVMFNVSRYVGS